MPIAGPLRHGVAVIGMAGGRQQRREERLQHRHLEGTAPPGALALVERRHDRAIEMGAGHEVGDRCTGFERASALLAGRAHQPAHRLDRQVEGELVRVGPGAAESRGRGIDQPGIHLQEGVGPEAEPRHDSGSEVLHQHVRRAAELEQKLPAALGFQVQDDAALAAVQRAERIVAVTCPLPRHVAVRRLDLDDLRPRHRHQEGGVRSLEDVTEIEDAHACERQWGAVERSDITVARAFNRAVLGRSSPAACVVGLSMRAVIVSPCWFLRCYR